MSLDDLQTVSNLSMNGLNVSQYYSTYTRRTDGKAVYAGSQDQGLQLVTIDNGNVLKFDQVISGDYGHLSSGDSGRTLWCNYPGFAMFRSGLGSGAGMPQWTFEGTGVATSRIESSNMGPRCWTTSHDYWITSACDKLTWSAFRWGANWRFRM